MTEHQVWQIAGSPNYVPRRIKKVERAHLFLFEGSKVSTFATREKDIVWSSKNAFVSRETTGHDFPSTLYVLVVSDQSPSSDCHNGEKRSAGGFLQCLFPLTEPEYMKAFSSVKILESIRHGQDIFAERSRCCRGGPELIFLLLPNAASSKSAQVS